MRRRATGAPRDPRPPHDRASRRAADRRRHARPRPAAAVHAAPARRRAARCSPASSGCTARSVCGSCCGGASPASCSSARRRSPARTAISLASGSTIVYFLQPSLGTALVASAFLISVPLGRPLAGKLAADFCPLPDEMYANEHVRQFFRRISLLWAFAQASERDHHDLVAADAVARDLRARAASRSSWSVMITTIIVSTLWFRHSMARNGIHVRMPSWRRPAVQ